MIGILHMSFCKTHGEERFLTESLVVPSEGTRKSLVSGFKEVGSLQCKKQEALQSASQ